MLPSAPDLVLLPGLDGTGRLFEPFLAALPSDFRARVIAYPANDPRDLPALAALVLRELPQGKPLLLAESFSGLVALELLKNAPGRIGGAIFVGAFAEPPRPFLLRLAPVAARSAALIRSTPAFLIRRYCLGPDASAAQLNQLREALACVSPAVLAQRLAIVAMRHSFGKAPMDVPSCYIRASQDRLVPASCATWFQERFRDCELAEIDGPHFLLQARPGDVAQAVTRWIRGNKG